MGNETGAVTAQDSRDCPKLTEKMQRATFFEFGSTEEHYKYRDAVKKAYPYGNFPVFENCNHMQMQILDPEGFAKMMDQFIRTGGIDNLYFRRKEK